MDAPADNVDQVSNASGRQPLQPIPFHPLNKRPSPLATVTSPPVTPAVSKASQALTPPLTPARPQDGRAPLSADALPFDHMSLDGLTNLNARRIKEMDLEHPQRTVTALQKEPSWEETRPQPPTKTYHLIGSTSSGYEEYGRGVWSIVYRASELSNPEIPPPTLLTPPTSPVSTSTPATHGKSLLAVKAPLRRDAHKILDSEACILTYLHASPLAENFLVPFHGYDGPAHHILMGPVPLSLESRAKTSAKTARAEFSTSTMFDPVIGTSQWAHLALHLIAGLGFLHSKSCIHGDIKPANILLQPSPDPDDPIAYTPLYTDFSSSSVTSASTSPEQVSALTSDYTSPELLLSLQRGAAIATPASDVFALAATLLMAATGESPYAGARMEVQKLGMCREGRPLDFARNGEQGSRILKGREVSRVLEGAVTSSETRWSVEEWKGEAERVLESWAQPSKMPSTP